MRKIISLFTAVFFLAVAAVIPAFGAEPVSVYLNGTLLIYDDAQPQIINSRTMVPVRKTADYLGMTTEWNAKTETMTFTKGDRVIVHTMRSNIIYVNGQAFTFDTPSTNIQNRTMMPLRMLAEATGAVVEWDNASRRISITTESPTVLNASVVKNVVKSGETTTINITASSGSEKVKVIDTSDNSLVGESFTYSTDASGLRIFTVNWTPYYASGAITKTLKVMAGNGTGYNEAVEGTKNILATVTNDVTPQIKNYYADSRSVDKNDYVTVTVYANSATSKIKVENDFSSSKSEITNYTKSGDDNVFETKLKMTEKGTVQIYLYPGDNTGYQNKYETITVDVDVKGSSGNSSSSKTLTIKDIDYPSEAAVGEDIKVLITTTDDIEEVEVRNEKNKKLDSTAFTKEKNSKDDEYIWELSFEVSSSGNSRYTVYAFDDNGDEVKDYFRINGESYSSDDLFIISINQNDDNVKVDDKCSFTAKTTKKVDHIIVKDGSSELTKVTNSSSSGSYRSFDFSIKVESSNDRSYYLYAYDKDGVSTSKKFTLVPSNTEEPEIIDYDLKESTVDVDDEIEVDVYTNSAVTKIWIEDSESGRKMQTKRNKDDKDGDDYVFEFSFSPNARETGRRKFTIIAENEAGDTDEMDFKVKVED